MGYAGMGRTWIGGWKAKRDESSVKLRNQATILALLVLIGSAGFLAPSFAYYQNVVVPNIKDDPWQTLWNGNFNGSATTSVTHDQSVGISLSTHFANATFELGGSSGLTVTKNEAILIEIFSIGTTSATDAGAFCGPWNVTYTPALNNVIDFGCSTNLGALHLGTDRLYATDTIGGFATTAGTENITIQSSLARSWGAFGSSYRNAYKMVTPALCQIFDSLNPNPLVPLNIGFNLDNSDPGSPYSNNLCGGSSNSDIRNRPIANDILYGQFAVTSKNNAQSAGCHTLDTVNDLVNGLTGETRENRVCDNGLTNHGSNNEFITGDRSCFVTCGSGGMTFGGNQEGGAYNMGYQWTVSTGNAFQEDATGFTILLLWNSGGSCAFGFSCFNTKSNGDGTITMYDRGTSETANMISTDSVDFSVATSKALGIFEYFISVSSGIPVPPNNVYVGMNWCYYGTSNSTLSQSNYTPLSDGQVAFAVCQYVETVTSSKPDVLNSYVYLQKNIGQQLLADSAAGSDPLGISGSGNCPQSATLFICEHDSQPSSGFSTLSLTLNFTGGVTSGSTTQGTSYICTSHSTASGVTCNVGGAQSTQLTIANSNIVTTQTFPWLNINQKYHIGFALMPKGDTTEHVLKSGNPTLATGADIVSYFVPDIAKAATTDSSFLGWLGNTIGGAWNAVAGVLSPIIAPVFGLGNSLMAAVVAGLIQAGQLLISGLGLLAGLIVTVLNAVGNALGFGNVGTDIATLVASLVIFFTVAVPTELANLAATFLRYFDVLTILFSWLATAFAIMNSLLAWGIGSISFGVTLALTITKYYSIGIGLILIIFWFAYIADYGLQGYSMWFEFSKYLIFNLGIKPLAHSINFGIDVITSFIGLVPKPFVQMVAHKIPNIPIVDINGSFTAPNGSAEALRERNVFTILGFLVGFVGLVWYETNPALPGTIASITPVGTQAASTLPILELFTAIASLIVVITLPASMLGKIGLDLPGRQAGLTTRISSVPHEKVHIGIRKAKTHRIIHPIGAKKPVTGIPSFARSPAQRAMTQESTNPK